MLAYKKYLELTKPNVVLVMLITAAVGMLLAEESVQAWPLYFSGIVGIGLMSASAAVINHIADRNIDSQMVRTAKRPIVQGDITPVQALIFAAVLGAGGFVFLWWANNALVAWLTLVSLIGYSFIYTFYLKYRTSQNIVIGGLAGAMPPLLGWVAIRGTLSYEPFLLVLIIFVWTPPHFWALALGRLSDYERAGIPMLPITHGSHYTRLQILLYTLLLTLCSLLPWAVQMLGIFYLGVASILAAWFLWLVVQLYIHPRPSLGVAVFTYSIVYILLLFVAMLVDHFVWGSFSV